MAESFGGGSLAGCDRSGTGPGDEHEAGEAQGVEAQAPPPPPRRPLDRSAGGAVLLEARIDLKIAARRRLVPVILNPHRDKVCGLHLDDAIEPWLAERGFSNHCHETVFLESA